MKKAQIMGLIRHILTAAGTVMASHGAALSGSEIETGVGAVMTIIGLVWSAREKKAHQTELGVAQATGERIGREAAEMDIARAKRTKKPAAKKKGA